MTLDRLYKLVEHYSSKHYSGKTLTPELFTDVLVRESVELFGIVFRDIKTVMEQKQKSLNEAVSLIGGIEPFIKYKEGATVNGVGKLSLEEDYYYHDIFYLKLNSLYRPVEVVTEKDAQLLKTNMISRSLWENPIGVIDSKISVMFTPKQESLCNYSYLKLPAVPYYDYCIDLSNNTQVYMPVGSSIVVSPDTGNDLQDSGGGVIRYNVEHLSDPDIPYNSQTIELEWKDTEIIVILKNILINEGISLKDTELFQMVKADEK